MLEKVASSFSKLLGRTQDSSPKRRRGSFLEEALALFMWFLELNKSLGAGPVC